MNDLKGRLFMVLRRLWSFTGHTDFDVKLVKPVCFAILTVCSYSASLHFIQERTKNQENVSFFS